MAMPFSSALRSEATFVAKLLEISIIRLRRRPASWSLLVISSPGVDAKYIVGKHGYSDKMV